jgi:hypothetical protein
MVLMGLRCLISHVRESSERSRAKKQVISQRVITHDDEEDVDDMNSVAIDYNSVVFNLV